MNISPLAGKPAESAPLVDIPKLLAAYSGEKPDPSVPSQRVSFGTSGHRGTSFNRSFNEDHILAITQAICLYRKNQGTEGPLFIGIDTHALSKPAYETAVEVLAANGVEVRLAMGDEFTPTPVISHAILTYNRDRKSGLADGIVITPSHNPPQDGGFKYNPSNGGPADTGVTGWIERKANEMLEAKLAGVKRMPFEKAAAAATTPRHDFFTGYVADHGNVLEMDVIKGSGLRIGIDPLGGAGVHYWGRIAEKYGLDLTVVSEVVDPTFRFMTLDWDGQIRMDPSSAYAMQRLIAMKDRFDLSAACDTDHDRHGIVTRSVGLMPPNHYLSVAISYLYKNRPRWPAAAAIGKTVVSTQMIDRIAAKIGRGLLEVPVGFKWFVGGLLDSSICFGGEESAGASFSRLDGKVWTTDKDGFIPCLLAAELTVRIGKDPGDCYRQFEKEFGVAVYDRVEAPATRAEKAILERLSPDQVKETELAGEKIVARQTRAPGNGAPIGGLKVSTQNGWFAARPSGTEEIYKIYAESFLGKDHLARIVDEAQKLVTAAISPGAKPATVPAPDDVARAEDNMRNEGDPN